MMPAERALRAAFRHHVAQTSAAPLGLAIASARGSWLTDVRGRRYLDLIAGMGVANVGHGHPAVRRACVAQLRRHLHVMVYGEFVLATQVRLATRLADLAGPPFESVYFTNSGAEAIEGALKTARKHTGRAGIVGFELGFHGDTLGALSIGGNPRYREPFVPLLPGATILPWNDVRALARIDRRVAAVVIEPVQAEGGVRVADPAFLRALRDRCSAVGALLVFDEVVTGLGRTGTLFGFQRSGVRPDLLVLAKALGGGLPLGAFLGSRRVLGTLAHRPALAHVTTFGGHPLSCAAALAALDVTAARDLPGRAARVGAVLLHGLDRLRRCHAAIVRDVRGVGLLVAVELATPALTRRFAAQCLERGLVLNWTLHRDTVIRLAPPLTITRSEVAHALATMDAVLASLQRRALPVRRRARSRVAVATRRSSAAGTLR